MRSIYSNGKKIEHDATPAITGWTAVGWISGSWSGRALVGALCCAGTLAMLTLPARAADETPAAPSSGNAGTENVNQGTGRSSASSEATRSPEDDSLQKVGEARLRVLLWSIYTSRLYTPTGTYTESERPLRLEIEYLINVKSSALVDRTAREWDAMGREHPRQDDWLQRLNTLWPNIDKQDVLTLEVDENNVSTFFHNGDRLGRIDDPAFGQQFLDIWLSEDSTRPSLRSDLIGVTTGN